MTYKFIDGNGNESIYQGFGSYIQTGRYVGVIMVEGGADIWSLDTPDTRELSRFYQDSEGRDITGNISVYRSCS